MANPLFFAITGYTTIASWVCVHVYVESLPRFYTRRGVRSAQLLHGVHGGACPTCCSLFTVPFTMFGRDHLISSYSEIISYGTRFPSIASYHDLHLDVDLQCFCLCRLAKNFVCPFNVCKFEVWGISLLADCFMMYKRLAVIPCVTIRATSSFPASKRSSSIGNEVVPTSAIVISDYPIVNIRISLGSRPTY
jgi:hypothetical protein